RKVRPHRANQSGDAEGYGHKKPEGCAHSGAQPYILMTAQQEHSRSQQLAPHRFPSRFDQGYDRRMHRDSHTVKSSPFAGFKVLAIVENGSMACATKL